MIALAWEASSGWVPEMLLAGEFEFFLINALDY